MNPSLIRQAVPSVVSGVSMLCGLASVLMSSEGRFGWAGWLIVYSMVLDKADGAVARALGAGSALGVEMDSFSDFTVFGIAPAALTWFLATAAGAPVAWVAFAAAVCPLAAAVRLARFNVAGHDDHDFFSGVPTTFAAGLFATLVLSLIDLGLIVEGSPASSTGGAVAALPPAIIALSVLMLSGLRIPKLKRRASRALNVFQWSVAAVWVVLAAAQRLPEVLFLVGAGYLVAGCLAGRRTQAVGPGRAG